MENGTVIDVQTNFLTSAKKVIPIELSNDPQHSQNAELIFGATGATGGRVKFLLVV